MCGAIIALFIAIILLAMFVGSVFLTIGAVLLAVFLIRLGKYYQWSNKKPSTMSCPNCKSNRIKINSRVDGLSSASAKGNIFRFSDRRIIRNHIATCQDCGYDYAYFTKEDLEDIQHQMKTELIVSSVLFGVYLAFAFLSSLSSMVD